MAYRVAWSPRAVEDLEAIAQYISADSTAYAAAVVKTILNTARNFPRSGRLVPEIAELALQRSSMFPTLAEETDLCFAPLERGKSFGGRGFYKHLAPLERKRIPELHFQVESTNYNSLHFQVESALVKCFFECR